MDMYINDVFLMQEYNATNETNIICGGRTIHASYTIKKLATLLSDDWKHNRDKIRIGFYGNINVSKKSQISISFIYNPFCARYNLYDMFLVFIHNKLNNAPLLKDVDKHLFFSASKDIAKYFSESIVVSDKSQTFKLYGL